MPSATALTIAGRRIPTVLDDLMAEPIAFVVWDMQRGIAPRTTGYASIIGPIQRLTEAVRSSGDSHAHHCVPIVA